MNRDIYSLIGVHLDSLADIRNYLLAVRLNREYFWQLLWKRDFGESNPLNLKYQILYRVRSQVCLTEHTKTIRDRSSSEAEMIADVNRSNTTYRNKCQKYNLEFDGGDSSYIYISNQWIKLERRTINRSKQGIVIPVTVGLINRVFLSSIPRLMLAYFELDLSLYREQIVNTRVLFPIYGGKCFKSNFMDWRGVKYIILYMREFQPDKPQTVYQLPNDIVNVIKTCDFDFNYLDYKLIDWFG